MLRVPQPVPFHEAIFVADLAADNLTTQITQDSGVLSLLDLTNAHGDRVQAILDAHPAKAQAALDAAQTERTNETTLRDRATQALDTNRAFLAIASPTNAQTLAQVKALTKQNNGIIRLLLGELDGTD